MICISFATPSANVVHTLWVSSYRRQISSETIAKTLMTNVGSGQKRSGQNTQMTSPTLPTQRISMPYYLPPSPLILGLELHFRNDIGYHRPRYGLSNIPLRPP